MLLSDSELTFYHQTLGVPYVLVFYEFFEASFLSFLQRLLLILLISHVPIYQMLC